MATLVTECISQGHREVNGKEGGVGVAFGVEEEDVELTVCIPIDGSDPLFLRSFRKKTGRSSPYMDLPADNTTVQKMNLEMNRYSDRIIEENKEEDIVRDEDDEDDNHVIMFPPSMTKFNMNDSQTLHLDSSFGNHALSQPVSLSETLEITLDIASLEDISLVKTPFSNAADVNYSVLSEKHNAFCLSPSSSSLSPSNSSSTISDLFVLINGEESSGFDPEQRSKPRFRLVTELYGSEHEVTGSKNCPHKRHSCKQRG